MQGPLPGEAGSLPWAARVRSLSRCSQSWGSPGLGPGPWADGVTSGAEASGSEQPRGCRQRPPPQCPDCTPGPGPFTASSGALGPCASCTEKPACCPVSPPLLGDLLGPADLSPCPDSLPNSSFGGEFSFPSLTPVFFSPSCNRRVSFSSVKTGRRPGPRGGFQPDTR